MNYHDLHRMQQLLIEIPKGKVTTYGILAKRMRTSPRYIGYLLKNNPDPVTYPCYKVIKTDRSIGGYSGHISGEKVHEKRNKLRADGVSFDNSDRISAADIYTY